GRSARSRPALFVKQAVGPPNNRAGRSESSYPLSLECERKGSVSAARSLLSRTLRSVFRPSECWTNGQPGRSHVAYALLLSHLLLISLACENSAGPPWRRGGESL